MKQGILRKETECLWKENGSSSAEKHNIGREKTQVGLRGEAEEPEEGFVNMELEQ